MKGMVRFFAGFLYGVALFGVLELAVRWVYPERVTIYRPDPDALFRLKAGLDRDRPIPGLGRVVRLRTNAYGVRDDQDLDPAQADILLFGDSNVAALFAPFEETLGERVEAHLGGGARAANLGAPGYGPDQSVRRYLSLAPRARAKAVVVHVFADNDYVDLFQNNLFRRDAGGVWRDVDPGLRVREYLEQSLALGMIKGAMETLKGAPTAAAATPDQAIDFLRSETGRYYRNYLENRSSYWLIDLFSLEPALNPDGPQARNAKEILAHALARGKDAFGGDPACFVALIQPSEVDLGGRIAGMNQALLRHADARYHPRNLSRIALDAAESAGVGSIDLFREFEDAREKYYFAPEQYPNDGHWNEAGIDRAAELLARHLTRNGCL